VDVIITYRYRVKDKTSGKYLRRMSSAVNYAWNYCCATQREAQRRQARWPSRFDLVRLMTGGSAELGIHSDTLGAIARQFADSRKAAKHCPALSDGRKIEMPAFYRRHEQGLALAQRRKQKRRAIALHAKVKNCRRDFLHRESTRIVHEHARVIVGDVNAAGLAQTRMAKSVLDAGWSMFRAMLQYKCLWAGAAFEVVSERLSTQTCSDCASVGGPKGVAGLRMRHWTCSDCGALHDRDVNAARNLLFAGAERRPPVEEIPFA
jgi:IS605 OrfB family transposase